MKKTVFSLVVFIAAAICATAQDYRHVIKENPAWAACEMYYYDYAETDFTPAPKGYKPFYICHYGRHGSRYMSSSVETDAVRPVFEMAESCGLLTEAGKQYWKDLEIILLSIIYFGGSICFHHYECSPRLILIYSFA